MFVSFGVSSLRRGEHIRVGWPFTSRESYLDWPTRSRQLCVHSDWKKKEEDDTTAYTRDVVILWKLDKKTTRKMIVREQFTIFSRKNSELETRSLASQVLRLNSKSKILDIQSCSLTPRLENSKCTQIRNDRSSCKKTQLSVFFASYKSRLTTQLSGQLDQNTLI